jgi:hypothetical protein
MIRLLQKYKKWLACFLASLLCVVFSSVVIAQEPATSNSQTADVANTSEIDIDRANYNAAASHSEPNFYNYN